MEIKSALAGLSALAHEGRLSLFRQLVRAGPSGVAAGDLAHAVGANFTTVSAQLAVLANAGLVTNRREGRSIRYIADYDAIRSVMAFLMEDCCQGRPEILTPLASIAKKAAGGGSTEGVQT
ncbi:MAG: metalloregulator ArsR/SmtB family transcription factor [Pseudomonadota bacterium]